MVDLSQGVLQLLGFFLGLGVLYGGLRADLKRLHVQSAETARVARSARRRIRQHTKKVGVVKCPHSVGVESDTTSGGMSWRGVMVDPRLARQCDD